MEQFARVGNEKRIVRICLDEEGNVVVEEFLSPGMILNGKPAMERGWYALWRNTVAYSSEKGFPTFRKE